MKNKITFLGFHSRTEQMFLFKKIHNAHDINFIRIIELVYSSDKRLFIKFYKGNNVYALESTNVIVNTICTNFNAHEFSNPTIELDESDKKISITLLFNRVEKMCFSSDIISLIKL